MRKYTILLLISFIGIVVNAQSISATKNNSQVKKFTETKITKTNFNCNTKSTNAYIGESFEGTTFPPSGWTIQNPTGGSGWARQVAGATLPGWTSAVGPAVATGGGTAYAIANWNTGSSTSSTFNDQWLISPSLLVSSGDRLKFQVMTFSSSYLDSLDVLISTTTNSTSSFTTSVASFDCTTMTSSAWVANDIDISSYAGSTIYVAFREHISNNATNGSLFAIDLVQIGTTPSTDVAVNSIDIPSIIQPTSYIPMATVANIGSAAQSFTVNMTITPGSYSSTQTVNNLAGGGNQQVSFATFTGTNNTVYSVTVTATLSGDANTTNNTLTSSFTVFGLDPVLFNNTNIAADNSIVSMEFGGLSAGANLVGCADDFDVPANSTWTITSVYTNGTPSSQAVTTNIDRFDVYIYNDNAGMPGSLVNHDSVAVAKEGSNLDTAQTLVLNNPFVLNPGKYWISVFAVYDTATGIYVSRWNWKCGPTNYGDTCLLESTTTLFGVTSWSTLWPLINAVEKSFYFKLNGTFITGIKDNPLKNIEIYPNPSNGSLNITNAENANVIVYNLLGQVLKNANLNTAFNTLDLSDLSNGSYVVKVISNKNTLTKKINIIK